MKKRIRSTGWLSERGVEDLSPEAKLHASAPPSKSPGGIFSILALAPFKKTRFLQKRPGTVPETIKVSSVQMAHSKISSFLDIFLNKAETVKVNIFDHGIGFVERVSHCFKHESSVRAWEEWLDYYRGLYQGRSPEPFYFKRLLIRNGLPDYPNPYPPNSEEYYDFHPDGLIFIEFEILLSVLIAITDDKKEKSAQAMNSEWMTIEESVAEWDGDQSKEAHKNYQKALATWAFVLLHSKNIGRIRDVVHPENLEFITIYLLRNLSGDFWGLDMNIVAQRACRLKIIDNSWIQMLQQPSGPESSVPRKTPWEVRVSSPVTPYLPLDDWRKSRKRE